MGKVGFQLPTWANLSAEQENIINLRTDKNYAIVGSPGTGKSVMALYRAARIAERDDVDVTILVYNRPLMLYLETAINSNDALKGIKVNTYHSWINDVYRNVLKKPAPKAGPYDYDYEEVLNDFEEIEDHFEHIIIDETQDFPEDLIKAINIASENITCFIDPNQAIEKGKTGTIDIVKNICVECPIKLTTNYRNTAPICDLAELYFNGKGLFAKSYAGGAGADKPKFIKCDDYDDQVEEMKKIIINNKEKNIGILVNNKNLNATYEALSSEIGSKVNVQMYKSSARTDNIFEENGVKILSFGTMKGLEFDLVIVGRFEKMLSTGDHNADMNRAYVAITRACKELNVCYFGTTITDSKWANVFSPILKNRTLCKWV